MRRHPVVYTSPHFSSLRSRRRRARSELQTQKSRQHPRQHPPQHSDRRADSPRARMIGSVAEAAVLAEQGDARAVWRTKRSTIQIEKRSSPAPVYVWIVSCLCPSIFVQATASSRGCTPVRSSWLALGSLLAPLAARADPRSSPSPPSRSSPSSSAPSLCA